MAAQPSMYQFNTRPPVEAGDVAFVDELQHEIDQLPGRHASVAQMQARNIGRSTAIDMVGEVAEGDPGTVRAVTEPLAESFSPGLKSFFKSGVEDVLAMTVENADKLQEEA